VDRAARGSSGAGSPKAQNARRPTRSAQDRRGWRNTAPPQTLT